MKAKAFALIESLVAIAIIAALMAILLPSLNLVRERARSLHCCSNVRTLTLDHANRYIGPQRWYGKGLIEWDLKALHAPQSFSFYRTPADDVEWGNFKAMLKGHAYRQLQ